MLRRCTRDGSDGSSSWHNVDPVNIGKRQGEFGPHVPPDTGLAVLGTMNTVPDAPPPARSVHPFRLAGAEPGSETPARSSGRRVTSGTWRIFVAGVLTSIVSPGWSAAQIVDIGDRLELFVDSLLIDRMDGVELRIHYPIPAPPSDNPPSDGHYATVIKDGDLYRLYNRGGGKAAYDGDPVEHTEYFESRDGINWSRPDLGLFEVNGSRHNNVVLADDPPFSHNFAPFLDTPPGVPDSQRYKALAGTQESGLAAFVSEDGIHWSKLQKEPVFTQGIFDSQNVSFWSAAENKYVCYFRTWTGEGYTGLRTISRTTSDDFIHWSEPVAMHPNEPGEHLYTSGTHPYFRAPHIYVALPTRFQPDRGNATDILFMSSRGGNRFDRMFKEAFIRPGLDPSHWENRANYAAENVVPTGPAEMSIYVRGRRYTLRTDGFVSLHAGYSEGEVITKPFVFDGSSMILNVSTSAGGHVLVDILDEHDQPIDSYLATGRDRITGDAIEHTVTWSGSGDVGKLAGVPVRLRFRMREADVYSIRFSP